MTNMIPEPDREAAFNDIADAIHKLRAAFLRHHMKPPISIELGDREDGDRLRWLMPAELMRFDPDTYAKGIKNPEWVANLLGVEIRLPGQWRTDIKGKRHVV